MFKSLFRKKSISKILADAQQGYGDGEMAHGLQKVLGVRDLTALGMAAIIGAGIFSTIGMACFNGGPAVIFLFIGIAFACGFSALCYAEMASRIPVSGSAYTYSYATFGEIVAWIIGWDLIMEYAIGNVTVAISWSGNFVAFLTKIGVHLPMWLCKSFMEVKNAHHAFDIAMLQHATVEPAIASMEQLWQSAPHFFGIPVILNIPAFVITVLLTALVYIGIKESKNVSNAMVVFKIAVILIVILIGFFNIDVRNWNPFAPNGSAGVLKGVSAVFFAYIGFDALSTTAEECKDPQRDLPKGMLYSLLLATILYILAALVLTGMVKYTQLNNEAFLANAFTQIGFNWLGGIIAFSALIATASVLLVFQLGQPRIWMSMSRDGLLPAKFSALHPKYRTPWFATIVTGLTVGIPSLFMDAAFVTDMCSIGTLFAFILVCAGVIYLQGQKDLAKPAFKIPYINSQFVIPIVVIAVGFLLFYPQQNGLTLFSSTFTLQGGFNEWKHLIPTWLFYIAFVVVCGLAMLKKYSIIPVLGLLCCLYLISTLGVVNWVRFIVWLLIGILIYAVYGYRNSKLNTPK